MASSMSEETLAKQDGEPEMKGQDYFRKYTRYRQERRLVCSKLRMCG